MTDTVSGIHPTDYQVVTTFCALQVWHDMPPVTCDKSGSLAVQMLGLLHPALVASTF
jgi:hypothetical protein